MQHKLKHKWTTIKAIFSYLFPHNFQIVASRPKYCPILANHKSMESLFIQLSNDV